MDNSPVEKYMADHNKPLGWNYTTDLHCARFCFEEDKKQLGQAEAERSVELTVQTGLRTRLRKLNSEFAGLTNQGLLPSDRSMRKVAAEISGVSEALRIGETTILRNFDNRISSLQKLVANSETRLRRLETLAAHPEYEGENK